MSDDCTIVLDTIIDRGQQNMTNSKNGEELKLIDAGIYKVMELNSLGWINCDRFYNMRDLTSLKVDFDNEPSYECVKLCLIFKDINSVMNEFYFKDKGLNYVVFNNIPKGRNVRLSAISANKTETFSYSKDFILSNENVVRVKMAKIEGSGLLKLFDI